MGAPETRFLKKPAPIPVRMYSSQHVQQLPNCSTLLINLPIFEARIGRARVLAKDTVEIHKNQRGSVEFENFRPTLTHALLIAATIAHAEYVAILSDGALKVSFEPSAVLKALGHEHGSSRSWLKDLLKELQDVALGITTPGRYLRTRVIRKFAVEAIGKRRRMFQGRRAAETSIAALKVGRGNGAAPKPTSADLVVAHTQRVLIIYESEFVRDLLALPQAGAAFAMRQEFFRRLLGLGDPIRQAVVLYASSQEELNREVKGILQEIGAWRPKGDRLAAKDETDVERLAREAAGRHNRRLMARFSSKDDSEFFLEFGIICGATAAGEPALFGATNPHLPPRYAHLAKKYAELPKKVGITWLNRERVRGLLEAPAASGPEPGNAERAA